MVCEKCRKELPESHFPFDIKTYCKETKSYSLQPICKRCKNNLGKRKHNKEQLEIYKEARSRNKYDMSRWDRGTAIVGWNGSDEIYY